MRDPTLGRRLTVLFAVALAARLATLAFLPPDRPPVGDETDYWWIARSLAQGDGFDLVGRTSFRPPLLPLVMSPLGLLVDGGADVAHLRVANLAVGSLCPPLMFLALRRSPLRERAFLPSLVLAVWPPAVFLSAQALAEPLAMALVLASVAALPDEADARPAAEIRGGIGAGVLAGLAVLARPASGPACVLVGASQRGLRRAAWFAAGAALVVAPWVVRNWAIHGRPLLTTNTGVTLVGGNSAAALAAEWPGKWAHPDDVYAGAADPPDAALLGWTSLGEDASDRRFAADARAWIRANPGDFVRLCGHKLVRLVDPDQHSGKADARAKAVVGWATFLPVLLLAVPGAWLAWRERRRWAPWFALAGGTVATALVFYGDVRMRSAMDPALLAFAALALFRLRGSRGGDGRT